MLSSGDILVHDLEAIIAFVCHLLVLELGNDKPSEEDHTYIIITSAIHTVHTKVRLETV